MNREQLSLDFAIAGGHKCATTSLHGMLSAHPNVHMSGVKEPHYLAKAAFEDYPDWAGTWSTDDYAKIWAGATPGQLKGEASVFYVYLSDLVLNSISRELRLPPRIIVSVRNPISRAMSGYLDTSLKSPQERAATFDEAVEREFTRGAERLDGTLALRHLALGIYSPGIENFQRKLGAENVLILHFEDFVLDRSAVLREIIDFLELDPKGDLGRAAEENRGGMVWRNQAASSLARSKSAVGVRRFVKRHSPSLHRRIRGVAMKRLAETAPPMGADTRSRLSRFYRDEVSRLSELSSRDLSHWLT